MYGYADSVLLVISQCSAGDRDGDGAELLSVPVCSSVCIIVYFRSTSGFKPRTQAEGMLRLASPEFTY